MTIEAAAEAAYPSLDVPVVRPARAWGSVAVLLVLALVSLLDRQIIALLVDPIKADLRITDTEIGLLQGLAFTLFYSTAAIPLGWTVDNFSRRMVCWAGVTVWSLGTVACGLSGQFWQLFLARITIGAGEASLTPSSVSLISDLFPREKVGGAMGVFVSSISLGSGLALIVGGFIVDLLAGRGPILLPLVGAIAPWQAAFIAVGLPGLFVALLAFLIADPRPPRSPSEMRENAGTGFGAYFSANAQLIVCTLAGFSFAAFAFYAVASWTPAFLGRRFAMKIGQIGLFWGLIVAGVGTCGAILGGQAINHAARRGLSDAALAAPFYASLVAWPVLGWPTFFPTLAWC